MKYNVLVTGGAGYLGSVLVPRLLREGHNVTVLDNFMFGQNSLADACKYDGFEIFRGDVRDTDLVTQLMGSCDIVIPLAALVGAPICKQEPHSARAINYDAVKHIVSTASNDQRIIMPVTNSGYGIGQKNTVCDEESPLNPISLYGRTKVEAETVVLEKANSLTLRLATVFGMSPRMRIDLLVNDFVHRAVTDRTLVIFEGHFKRNYIHIQDVSNAFIHSINNFESMKGRAYNVGLDDANLSKLELAMKIKKHIPEFTYLEAPIGEDPDKRDYIVSNKRIYNTGFKPSWNLDRGINELIKGFTILRNSIYSNV